MVDVMINNKVIIIHKINNKNNLKMKHKFLPNELENPVAIQSPKQDALKVFV